MFLIRYLPLRKCCSYLTYEGWANIIGGVLINAVPYKRGAFRVDGESGGLTARRNEVVQLSCSDLYSSAV
jgi:hypothetical protein